MGRIVLTAGAVALALALAGCGQLSTLSTDENGVYSLTVGDCFDAGSQIDEPTEVETIPTVNCSQQHDYEVYASTVIDGGEYPGEAQTVAEADTRCTALLESFVGVTDSVAFAVSYFYPTSASWDLGDREILCLVSGVNEDGELEKVSGTLRDAGA